MRVAAVVVRYRGGDEVRRCLDSLREHGGAALSEVVLVDSGSGDGAAAGLAEAYPGIEVIELAENVSFASAANHGASATSAELIYLLNPDAQVLPGSTDALLDFLSQHPRIAAAAPLLENPDGTSQHRWQLRSLPGALRLALGLSGAPSHPGPAPERPTAIAQPAAAAWLVRRPVWEALGGLDDSFAPAWWEDVDFCARLDSGLREGSVPANEGFWLVPGAKLRHEGGSSLTSLSEDEFLIAFNRNLLRYARRHHPGTAGLIRVALRCSLLARAMLRPGKRASYQGAFRAV